MQVALKCADIGHLSCPLMLHQRWTDKLREEFFIQVCPLMDRALCQILRHSKHHEIQQYYQSTE